MTGEKRKGVTQAEKRGKKEEKDLRRKKKVWTNVRKVGKGNEVMKR